MQAQAYSNLELESRHARPRPRRLKLALVVRSMGEYSQALPFTAAHSVDVVEQDQAHLARIDPEQGQPQRALASLDRVLEHGGGALMPPRQRWGGEEFLLILPETMPDTAVASVDRLRALASGIAPAARVRRSARHLSAGLAASGADVRTLDEIIARADAALYEDKNGGRDLVRIADEPRTIEASQGRRNAADPPKNPPRSGTAAHAARFASVPAARFGRVTVAAIFTRKANLFVQIGLALFALGAVFFLLLIWGVPLMNYNNQVSFTPEQPVPFSHKHHVSGLGIDCRYCHDSVEYASNAGMPPTETCMTCHSQVWTNAAILEPVRQSLAEHEPLRWESVYTLPDYVFFDHSIHIAKGVGCTECHGPIGDMPLTYKATTLYMSWCLGCHRNPAPHLRPLNAVFDPHWHRTASTPSGKQLMVLYHIHPKTLTDCSVCHR